MITTTLHMLLSVQQKTLMNVKLDMENGKDTFGNENKNIFGVALPVV